MAFNKLRIFELVRYTRILWLDSDSLVLHNVDHSAPTTRVRARLLCPGSARVPQLDGRWEDQRICVGLAASVG